MIQRCFNPKHARSADDGGRGIKGLRAEAGLVSNFLADLGIAPEGMSIERDKTDGDYEQGRFRWATLQE